MTITFSDEACAAACTWKTHLLLKRQFKNKTRLKGICHDITPISGNSAGHREKRSDNCTIDSQWA